jgi:hypothetical protein
MEASPFSLKPTQNTNRLRRKIRDVTASKPNANLFRFSWEVGKRSLNRCVPTLMGLFGWGNVSNTGHDILKRFGHHFDHLLWDVFPQCCVDMMEHPHGFV